MEQQNDTRLAQGCNQERGLDYEETFAPVAKITATQTIMAYVIFNAGQFFNRCEK